MLDRQLPKVSAIQMRSSDNVKENLETASKLIFEAKQQGSQLVVLPEMFATLGNNNMKEAYGHGMIQDFISHTAKKYQIWIVAGTIPIDGRAACLVYDHLGKVVARYDKIHLFDVVISEQESYKESDTVQPGEDIIVLDTPIGKLGLSVCYDIRFPELYRALFNKGAEIIAIPAAFTVKTGQAHWEILARARAIENFCYVIGSCQSGTHYNGRQTYGHSLIIDPWGNIKTKLTTEQNVVITTEIDLAFLKQVRKNMSATNQIKQI